MGIIIGLEGLTCGEVEYEHKEQEKEFKEMFIREGCPPTSNHPTSALGSDSSQPLDLSAADCFASEQTSHHGKTRTGLPEMRTVVSSLSVSCARYSSQ